MRLAIRTLFVTVLVALSLVLAPAYAAGGGGGHGGEHAEEGEHGGGHAEHHPSYSGDADHDGTANWMDSDAEDYVLDGLIFHLVNFLIYAGILYFAAGSMLRDGARARALGIKRDISEATELRDAAQARNEEVSNRLAALESEIATLHERARTEAEAEEKRIDQRARDAATRIAETAQRQIRDEAVRAKNEIRREAVELAVKLAEDILSKQVQPADQRRLAQQFLDTLQSDGDHHV
jgi:F-type H+-transporting ATPase subunit b